MLPTRVSHLAQRSYITKESLNQSPSYAKMLPYLLLASLICSISVTFQCPKASAESTEIAKPGCQDRCGPTEIPYPFGINRGCYLDETFEVTCNESTGSASLTTTKWEIDEISVSTHNLRHRNFSAFAIEFDRSGKSSNGHAQYMTFINTRYSTSHARNVFFAIGCDLYTYIVDQETNEFRGGCASLCDNDVVTDQSSTCSGMHCCQISFDGDLRNVKVGVETMNTRTKSWAGQCGFFGFVDKGYPLNKTDFSACNGTYFAPIIHDWAVGDTSCDVARGRDDYACGENTNCVDYTQGTGYRCVCNNGYQGNPYLPSGCQDINECADPNNNNCRDQSLCENTAGSYYCLPDRRRIIKLFIPLGTGLAVGLVTLAICGFWALRKLKSIKDKKTKEKFFKRNGGLLLEQQMFSSGGRLIHELILFGVEELKKATDNFNESRVLGKGGSGTVYKGMLSDGRIVAVKKADIIDDKQVSQFINEVFVLSQINHRHIVKLLGCCLESEVPLLAYEFISNGTLSDHLHNVSNSSVFSWEDRLRIASEVAGALAYMHSYASTAIIHRDVKSSNILLDENYRAVVSDFGLSKSVSIDRTHLTTVVRGTFGYMDPDYFRSGQLNDKSDVYAFGVVLAEILTGEKAVSSTETEQGLAIRFVTTSTENYLFETLEQVITSEDQKQEIVAVADLAKRCLKSSARKRPSMKEVSAELDQIRKIKVCSGQHEESFIDHEYRSVSERSFSYGFDSYAEDDQKLFLTK